MRKLRLTVLYNVLKIYPGKWVSWLWNPDVMGSTMTCHCTSFPGVSAKVSDPPPTVSPLDGFLFPIVINNTLMKSLELKICTGSGLILFR